MSDRHDRPSGPHRPTLRRLKRQRHCTALWRIFFCLPADYPWTWQVVPGAVRLLHEREITIQRLPTDQYQTNVHDLLLRREWPLKGGERLRRFGPVFEDSACSARWRGNPRFFSN
jgi:hypothetical protein